MTLLLVMVAALISHTIYMGVLYYNQSQSSRLINQRAFYESRIQRLVAQDVIDQLEESDRWQLELKMQQVIDKKIEQIKNKLNLPQWITSEPLHYVSFNEEGYVSVKVDLYVHEYWQDTPWKTFVPKGYVTNRTHQKVDTLEEVNLDEPLEGYVFGHEVKEKYFDRLYYRTVEPITIPFLNGELQLTNDERKQQKQVLSFIDSPIFTSRKFEPMADFYFLMEVTIQFYLSEDTTSDPFNLT